MRSHLLGTGLLLVLSGAASAADTLVAATGGLGSNTNTIYAIDVDSGVGTMLFPMPVSVLGMAADDTGRLWFTAEDGGLYTFVLGDAAPTFVGMLTRSALGSNLRMDGLAWRDGTLYGWQEFDDFASGTEAGLYTIDTVAVTRSLLLAAPDDDLRSGLDVDPATGLFYLANDMDLTFEVLDTGDNSLAVLGPYPFGEVDLDGLAVGGGSLWAIEDDPGPGGQIYRIDLATGAVVSTIPNPWSGQGLFAAGAWVAGCHPPEVHSRNEGANPESYVCYAVVVGGRFEATVDNASHGQLFSRLFALDSPVVFPLAGGQILLALDLLGSGEYFTGSGIEPTSTEDGLDTYSFPVPSNALLCDFPIYTQAIQYGSPPFLLSNAQDVTIGG